MTAKTTKSVLFTLDDEEKEILRNAFEVIDLVRKEFITSKMTDNIKIAVDSLDLMTRLINTEPFNE